jgi:hypothetical protein
MVIAALGASVHALTSFTSFLGNRTFQRSWVWWYVMRIPIGIALALIFYFALRGGLLSVQSSTGAISPYGIAAIAGLTGLFSKQVTDKLEEVFTTLFRTAQGGDAARVDNLTPGFTFDRASPPSLDVRASDPTVKVYGTGFADGMTATVSGATRGLQFISATECKLTLTQEDVATAGSITVMLTAPGGTHAGYICFDLQIHE